MYRSFDADLSEREPYASLVETHSGVVIFLGDKAYKLKKSVRFDFLDFTDPIARLHACERELELNSRLAPDVYLGVKEVSAISSSESRDTACEYLVVMRRLPESLRLSKLALTDVDLEAEVERIAYKLARFHEEADRSQAIDRSGSPEAVLKHWDDIAAQMMKLASFDQQSVEKTIELARQYLAGREALFLHRIAENKVCDGHGDLMANDIFCLQDGPRILDCLEFDDELRYGDVLSDIAFLAMDLESIHRPDLACSFLDHYRRATTDDWPASLAHHYMAYRAYIRSLVCGLRADQNEPKATDQAHQLMELATYHLRSGRVRLVVVGGLPGSGKSTLAAQIAVELDAVVLHSDQTRKEAAGLDPKLPSPAQFEQDLYRPEITAATYAKMLGRARSKLSSGQSVVLDATFHDPIWREAARALAAETASDLDELHCTAPMEVLAERLVSRRFERNQISDATPEILRKMAENQEPWTSASSVDTSKGNQAALKIALEVLGLAEESFPKVTS